MCLPLHLPMDQVMQGVLTHLARLLQMMGPVTKLVGVPAQPLGIEGCCLVAGQLAQQLAALCLWRVQHK